MFSQTVSIRSMSGDIDHHVAEIEDSLWLELLLGCLSGPHADGKAQHSTAVNCQHDSVLHKFQSGLQIMTTDVLP
jgi:hypothetical protein